MVYRLFIFAGVAFVFFGSLIVLYPYLPEELRVFGAQIGAVWIRYNEGAMAETAVFGSSYITPKDERVVAYSAGWRLPRYPTGADFDELREVYEFVCVRARWKGTDAQWSRPRDMLIFYERNGYFFGDCEDYATLLTSFYRAAGVAPDAVRVVIGKLPEATWGGGGHATTQIKIENRWLYLEPYADHTFSEYAFASHPLAGRETIAFSDAYVWRFG